MRSSKHARCVAVALAAVFSSLWAHPADLGAQSTAALEEPTAAYGEPFSLISGVRELEDGRVLVSDALEESLYALDAPLSEALKIARNGQGPDEYRQPDALHAWPGDSTLMTDLGNGRLTVIGPDYGFGRTIPVVQQASDGLQIILPQDVDTEGSVYYQPRGDGMIRDTSGIVRWNPDSAAEPVEVARIKLSDVTERTSGDGGNMHQEVRQVPMSPQDGWAVGLDGSVAVVRVGDYHVDWVRPDGRVISGPPVAYEPVRVRQADKEAWVETTAARGVMMAVTNQNGNLSARMRRGGGRGVPSIDGYEWPETKPPFEPGSAVVAPDGDLWVMRSVAAGERPLIDVFDANGRHRGAVALPEGREVVGFGEGSVYLARGDDLGFQWLERYDRPEL